MARSGEEQAVWVVCWVLLTGEGQRIPSAHHGLAMKTDQALPLEGKSFNFSKMPHRV